MWKFGFGPRRHLYDALQRIWVALEEIRAEQESLRMVVGIARAEGATVAGIWAELRSAEVRTQVYTSVARENIVDAFGQPRPFNRSTYAPADATGPALLAYIRRVAEPLYGISADRLVSRAEFHDHVSEDDIVHDRPEAAAEMRAATR